MTDESEAEAKATEPTETATEGVEADASDSESTESTESKGAGALEADPSADAEVEAESDAAAVAVAVDDEPEAAESAAASEAVADAVEDEQPEASESAAEDTEPATVDVAAAITTGVTAPLSTAGRRFGAFVLEALLATVTLVVGWLIWSLVVWSRGQTPAKSLLSMRVVNADTGLPASWGTMFLREFVGKWLLGAITLSVTTIVSGFKILGESRQGIWDKIAGTVVVDDR